MKTEKTIRNHTAAASAQDHTEAANATPGHPGFCSCSGCYCLTGDVRRLLRPSLHISKVPTTQAHGQEQGQHADVGLHCQAASPSESRGPQEDCRGQRCPLEGKGENAPCLRYPECSL